MPTKMSQRDDETTNFGSKMHAMTTVSYGENPSLAVRVSDNEKRSTLRRPCMCRLWLIYILLLSYISYAHFIE